MLSVVSCATLGVLCVILGASLGGKIDRFISDLFFWLGIVALVAATLFAVTEEVSGWMSGLVLVLMVLSISAQPKKRQGHL